MKQGSRQTKVGLAGVHLKERERLMAQAYMARSEYFANALAGVVHFVSKAMHGFSSHQRGGLAH